jgi:hypothetical protein
LSFVSTAAIYFAVIVADIVEQYKQFHPEEFQAIRDFVFNQGKNTVFSTPCMCSFSSSDVKKRQSTLSCANL